MLFLESLTVALIRSKALTHKPVISENISTFTVVLEFIEIALPVQSTVDKV